VVYHIRFSDAAGEHLASLAARDRATLLDRIGRPLTHQPTVETRNRKRIVKEKPEPVVVIVAVGIKVRERITIGGKDIKS
jgi:hypothetical protein